MTAFYMVIWVIIFVFLPRSRPAILWTSIMLALAGPVAEYWLIPSYWNPLFLVHISYKSWNFGIEDFLITFAIAGISASGATPRASYDAGSFMIYTNHTIKNIHRCALPVLRFSRVNTLSSAAISPETSGPFKLHPHAIEVLNRTSRKLLNFKVCTC